MKFKVELILPDYERKIIEIDKDEYILDAAYRDDIDLPSRCRQGYCITCACKLIEGMVDQSEAVRIYPVDIQENFVLICSAKPLSNLKLLTHQKNKMQKHRIKHKLPTTLG
jgi:ferredoxin